MIYYIQKSDELYHYGVKGMRWGHRKDPEKASNGRKRMSTVKKVAIGITIVAAIAGVSYVGVKAYKTNAYNKVAKAAVEKAMRQAKKDAVKRANKAADQAAGMHYYPDRRVDSNAHFMQYKGNVYKHETGSYRTQPGPGQFDIQQGKTVGFNRSKQLTGHSQRVTKVGAARHRANYYTQKARNTAPGSGYFEQPLFDPKRRLERRASEAINEVESYYSKAASKGAGIHYYSRRELNRLKR